MPDADLAPPPTVTTPAAAPSPPRRRGVLRATAVVATVGVLVALVGVVVLALPVHAPLQDCGTTFTYLFDGKVDTLGDPAKPPKGHSSADVRANNAKTCHDRVVDKAKPAAVLLLGGLAVALAATATEMAARWRLSRRDRRPHAPRRPSA